MVDVPVTAGMIVERLAELLVKEDAMVLVTQDVERILHVLAAAVLVLVVLFPVLVVKADAREDAMGVLLLAKDALVVTVVVPELVKVVVDKVVHKSVEEIVELIVILTVHSPV